MVATGAAPGRAAFRDLEARQRFGVHRSGRRQHRVLCARSEPFRRRHLCGWLGRSGCGGKHAHAYMFFCVGLRKYAAKRSRACGSRLGCLRFANVLLFFSPFRFQFISVHQYPMLLSESISFPSRSTACLQATGTSSVYGSCPPICARSRPLRGGPLAGLSWRGARATEANWGSGKGCAAGTGRQRWEAPCGGCTCWV